MATETRHSGTLRTDYEADRARLEELRPLTADTDILLHCLTEASRKMPYRDADGREGTLTPLLENHVLTVLADIRRKRLVGYGCTFADAQGTAAQARYARKLEQDVERWAARLEAYLRTAFAKGMTGSPAVQIAGELHDRLSNALRTPDGEDNRRYYRMLRTVTAIQENADRYWQQAADSGDTEPALALLVAYLNNYASIADAFNRRFASLPELYRREVLHARPAEAVPDNAYLVITPAGKGFTLKEGTAFSAGEDLIYKTTQEEYISPMRCVEVNAIRLSQSSPQGAYIQTLHFGDASNAETLFATGEELRTGWQIESPMLVLEEGERKVSIRFSLAADSPVPDVIPADSFILRLSTPEGWTKQLCTCTCDGNALCFGFTLGSKDTAPSPCTEEAHGIATACPALRILTNNTGNPYEWARDLRFNAVEIRTEAGGIRNFTFCNELGEADTTQPFSPFGIEAEHGAWFLFGNREMGLKPLREVRLKGTWQKLPETEAAFNARYKDYGSDLRAFTLRTEYQQDGRWHPCAGDTQHLFTPDTDEERSLARADIVFSFPSNLTEPYTYDRDKDGFFRATLSAPETGFGTKAYRELFTRIMVENSHSKKKDMQVPPAAPDVPLLADVELSYTASERLALDSSATSTIRLSRLTELSDKETFPAGDSDAQPLLPAFPGDRLLYFRFHDAAGEKALRMYIDTALPQASIPFGVPGPGLSARLSWEYFCQTGWKAVPAEAVVCEETAGLTQSGFIEIDLSGLGEGRADSQGRLWLRASVTGDVSACLALRGVWTNCIRVTADGGNGMPLPSGTIQGTVEEDPRIGSVTQPLPGFGGTPAGTEAQSATHQTARFANRHRAVTPKDYELLVLEHFPEIDKAQCFTRTAGDGLPETCLVVFSRAEDSRYFLSPAWKLAEIRRLLEGYAPPFVRLKVANPVYQRVDVHFKAVLHNRVKDESAALRELTVLARNYLAPWISGGDIPAFRQCYSYKELHARLVNHEAVMRLALLEVDGQSLEQVDYDTEDIAIRGGEPWSIPVPAIRIELLSPADGIGESEIGANFIIR